MEASVDYDAKNQYALVSIKEQITNEVLIDTVKTINNLYIKRNFNKILIDCSKQIEDHHLLNIYNLIRTFDILFTKPRINENELVNKNII